MGPWVYVKVLHFAVGKTPTTTTRAEADLCSYRGDIFCTGGFAGSVAEKLILNAADVLPLQMSAKMLIRVLKAM